MPQQLAVKSKPKKKRKKLSKNTSTIYDNDGDVEMTDNVPPDGDSHSTNQGSNFKKLNLLICSMIFFFMVVAPKQRKKAASGNVGRLAITPRPLFRLLKL